MPFLSHLPQKKGMKWPLSMRPKKLLLTPPPPRVNVKAYNRMVERRFGMGICNRFARTRIQGQ